MKLCRQGGDSIKMFPTSVTFQRYIIHEHTYMGLFDVDHNIIMYITMPILLVIVMLMTT